MLNALTEKGQKAKKKERERETFIVTLSKPIRTLTPLTSKVTVIELVSCRPGLPRQWAYLRNLLWEGSHLIMHASDACQAGLFPQLIFFHIPPRTPNLIILAPRQIATAFRWCIQYQRPPVTGWSIRWRGRVLAGDSAPQSNEASPTLWAWAERVTLEMHEGQ